MKLIRPDYQLKCSFTNYLEKEDIYDLLFKNSFLIINYTTLLYEKPMRPIMFKQIEKTSFRILL